MYAYGLLLINETGLHVLHGNFSVMFCKAQLQQENRERSYTREFKKKVLEMFLSGPFSDFSGRLFRIKQFGKSVFLL